MTKTILLTATALAAMAFAGAANAQVVSAAEVSNITVRATGAGPGFVVTNSPYGIATESNITAIADRRTLVAANNNDITFGTTAGRLLEYGTTYTVTYALSGTATPTFAAQVSAGALTVGGVAAACVATGPSVVAGTGATGTNSVTFQFTTAATGTAGCAADGTVPTSIGATASFLLDVPFTIASVGGVTGTITGGIAASNTNAGANPNRFSTTASAANQVELVRSAAGYRIFADAAVDGATGDGPDNADVATQLLLGTSGAPFRTLSTDKVIGAAGFITAPTTGMAGIFAGLDATTLPNPTYTMSISATGGDFSVLKPEVGVTDALGTDATVATNNLSATVGTSGTPIADNTARSIGLRIEGAPTASIATTPQTYTVTVTPIAPLASGNVVTPPGAVTNASLETVGLQGTTFVAPWVQSSNANYNTVIRLSNSGAATGSVQLTLTSALNAPTRTVCTATELSKLSVISAGGELAINSADLTTCFGAFGRGDVSVTVLSLANNLTAKLRIVNPGNIVAEQSLGRFGSPTTY